MLKGALYKELTHQATSLVSSGIWIRGVNLYYMLGKSEINPLINYHYPFLSQHDCQKAVRKVLKAWRVAFLNSARF